MLFVLTKKRNLAEVRGGIFAFPRLYEECEAKHVDTQTETVVGCYSPELHKLSHRQAARIAVKNKRAFSSSIQMTCSRY